MLLRFFDYGAKLRREKGVHPQVGNDLWKIFLYYNRIIFFQLKSVVQNYKVMLILYLYLQSMCIQALLFIRKMQENSNTNEANDYT